MAGVPPELVTETSHDPTVALVIGQLPPVKLVEFAKVNPVQVISVPLLLNFTAAPDAKFVPVIEVIVIEPVFTPVSGTIAEVFTVVLVETA